MTKKKRRTIIIAGAAALAAVLVVVVYAFVGRTTSADTLNTITTGLIDIKLHEKVGGDDVVVDKSDEVQSGMTVKNILPGQSQTKTLYVENADTEAAWVRVKVEKAFTKGGGSVTEVTVPTETRAYDAEKDIWNITEGTETKTLDPDLVDVSLDGASGSGWIYKDGYFYFKPVLDGTTITPDLVLKVSFSGDMGNEYSGLDVKVNVSAEAVQARNNPDYDWT